MQYSACWMLDFLDAGNPEIKHQISKIKHQKSSIKYRVSSIKYQASRIRQQKKAPDFSDAFSLLTFYELIG